MNNSGNHSGQQQPPQQAPQPQPGALQMPGLLSPTGALEHYRLSQLYQYAMAAERLRCQPGSGGASGFLPPLPPGLRPELAPFLYGPYCRIDPRLAMCRPPDEPKPQHSYIGLIAMAILSSPDKKLVLSDIYQYILDNYPYFRTRGPGWRNSIRHNLSLNDCFIKSGRSANGKGHYWAIHPANVDDFTKGDFRRRKAQRKVRRHMGLAVDDEDSPSPPPSSPPPVHWPDHPHHPLLHHLHQVGQFHPHPHFGLNHLHANPPAALDFTGTLFPRRNIEAPLSLTNLGVSLNRKRQFDVASLLAPEKSPRFPAVSPASTIKSEIEETEQCHSSPSPPISKVFKHDKIVDTEEEDSDDTGCDPITVDEDKDPSNRVADSTSSDNNEADPAEESVRKVVRRRHHHCHNSGTSSGSSHRAESVTSGANGGSGIPSGPPGHSPSSLLECQQQQMMLGLGPVPQLRHPHHHAQQANFHFNPSHPHPLLQHNPSSLASLMILSSRYRELTSSMANNVSKRSSQ